MKSRLFALLLILLILAQTAFAQDDSPQLETDIEILFGASIRLSASLSASKTPIRATVFLRPTSQFDTHVVGVDLTPDANRYSLEASLDMRAKTISPFERIVTWWQIDFEDGDSWESPAQEIRYEDTRFPWQKRADDFVSVHWVNGGVELGEQLLDLSTNAITSISQNLGLLPPGNVSIYIYPSTGDLQSALQIGGAPWLGGQTLPEVGVILLSGIGNAESMITFERDIPHELTHLMLYEKLQEAYSLLPAWLNEGLATLQETQPNPAYRFELEQAVKGNGLLTMESLCTTFPVAEDDALLGYAQSASFTRYLLDVYGLGGILQLLDAYQEGASCTGGIQRIYQRPLAQLENEWKALHLQSPTVWDRMLPILPWGLLLLFVLILVLIGLVARRQRSG